MHHDVQALLPQCTMRVRIVQHDPVCSFPAIYWGTDKGMGDVVPLACCPAIYEGVRGAIPLMATRMGGAGISVLQKPSSPLCVLRQHPLEALHMH
jgi:hypothetical protein